MKKCLVLLLLTVSLAACTPLGDFLSGARATDVAATEIAAVAATETAAAPTPTFTPTPTPTSTFTPTPTPTSTFTQTPTASPSPTSSRTPVPTTTPTPFSLPEGWLDYGGEGFALALPESWNVVEVDREGIDVILEALAGLGSEWAEGIAASVSAEQMQEALKLWAMDTELAGLGYATLNLQRQAMPFAMPLDMLLDQMEATYEQLKVEVVSIEPEIQVNGLEAGLICVRMEQALATARMYQYLIVDERDLWVLTIGVDEEAWAKYEPIFVQIAETFRLK